MEHHKLYGLSVPEKKWVPAPSYLLRRDRILLLMKKLQPGLLLEIGCGAGTLLHDLNQYGFICEALETSPSALEIARHINTKNVIFHNHPQPKWKGRFGYLLAFEVLEHIEHDREALVTWCSWLKPGGMMIISVPAHMRKWTASDVWAGHFRRYERQELVDLISKSGFTIKHFEGYGFPLANLISPFRVLMHSRNLNKRRKKKHDGRGHGNALSGIARNTEAVFYPLLKSFPGTILMYLAYKLQGRYAGQDWGNGYVVAARKK